MKRFANIVAAVVLALTATIGSGESEEVHYASENELKLELAERKEDILRTEARLAKLATSEIEAKRHLEAAKIDGKKAEEIAVERTRIFYSISKNGAALRFILNATSIIDMLKRLALMKRLFAEALEARREAGLRIAAAEQQLQSIRADKEAAYAMLAMLTHALDELSLNVESAAEN